MKKWIRNFISEIIRENFPPINIQIGKSPQDKIFLLIKGGTFVHSKIEVTTNDMVCLDECYVETEDGFFSVRPLPQKED